MLDFSGMSVEQYEEHFKNHMEPFMENLFLMCTSADGASETTTLNVKVHGEEYAQALSVSMTTEMKAFIKNLVHTAQSEFSSKSVPPLAVWFITQTLGKLEAVQRTKTFFFDVVVGQKYFQEFNKLWSQWWYLRLQDVAKDAQHNQLPTHVEPFAELSIN